MKNNIMEVAFVSVWDGGVGVETSAKYNSETGVVFDIETREEGVEELEVLELEYIRLNDGTELSVSEKSCEYRIIDFADILRKASSEDIDIAIDEDYPLFDKVLMDFAEDNDVILNSEDIEEISSCMDVDCDGYPYILQEMQIPKYKCRFSIRAYHYGKWSFSIEGFRVIE